MSSTATIESISGASAVSFLATARRALDDAAAGLDVSGLSGEVAADLLSEVMAMDRVSASLRYALLARVDSTGVYRDRGYGTAASMVADVERVGLGMANGAVRTSKRLASCPATATALARGTVSEAQARVIVDAVADGGVEAPQREASLLAGAKTQSWSELDADCRRAKAAMAAGDPQGAYKRIHAARYVKHWTDEEGALRLTGRFTPDLGAKVVAALEASTQVLFDEARKAGRHEPTVAYAADALCGMVINGLGGDGSKPVGASRSPRTVVHVRIDRDALLRGYPQGHELSEIRGVGPIPVPVVQDLMTTAGIRAIFLQAEEISKIYHFKRTINQHLLTALMERDPCCVVPGCGATQFLEIDHIIPFAEGGPTTYWNLARLCWFHHHQKTNDGFVLTKDEDGWHFFDPQPPFGQEPDLGADLPKAGEPLHSLAPGQPSAQRPAHPPPKN